MQNGIELFLLPLMSTNVLQDEIKRQILLRDRFPDSSPIQTEDEEYS